MLFVYVLICGIVLVRKKLPKIEKVLKIGIVARDRKSCQKVAENLVDSLNIRHLLLVAKICSQNKEFKISLDSEVELSSIYALLETLNS